jgi:hypothetical protein
LERRLAVVIGGVFAGVAAGAALDGQGILAGLCLAALLAWTVLLRARAEGAEDES